MAETKQSSSQVTGDTASCCNTTEPDVDDVRGNLVSEESTTSLTVDPFLIECPICLEQLVQPKSLPCLHTFCLKCLSDCIIKNDNPTTFPCPICRKVTMPPDSSLDKGTWAAEFPTNNLIVEMIKYTQHTATGKLCDPCRRRTDRQSPAVRWCRICSVYLCQNCEDDFHGFLHSNVETLHVSELNQSPLKANTALIRCSKHKKKMSLFCEDHQALLCSLCVAVSHRTCCSVLTPPEYAQKLTSDTVIRTRLAKGEHVMDALVKDFSTQLELLEHNKQEAEHSISEESQNINNIVKRLHDQSMSKLIGVYKEQKERLETSIQRCKSLKNSMTNTGKVSGVISSGSDSIQKISIYQRGKAEIESCTQVVHDLVRPFEGKVLSFEPVGLHEKIKYVESLGKISVINQIRDYPSAVDKWLPLSDRIATHHSTVSVKLDADKQICSVRDVMWFDDDVILLTDANNKKVKLFAENGDFIDSLNLADRPWAVCKLPGNRAAVTRPDSKTISVIMVEEKMTKQTHDSGVDSCVDVGQESSKPELSSDSSDCEARELVPDGNEVAPSRKRNTVLRLEKDIVIDRPCYGVCYVGDKFIVSNGRQSPYQVYSVMPDGRTDLMMEHESPSYYITGDITQPNVLVSLISSIPGNAAIYRMPGVHPHDRANVNVSVSPVTGGSLTNAHGVDVDREGNVYMCCGGLPGLVQVTVEGGTVRELVGVVQGVKDPRAVAMIQNKVVLADVDKANANSIKIFHLR
ncbi:uncharacterized protein LOC110442284 isoform X2 [Mizuhopecten yessoensis]|uniref:E3 ubiquitin-protein ligase TRIM56 n=2 Tax=Mizuhopecten yessoensis TaxID=6573 RepID=A0A210R0W4_MIZYE|nr:uncharacterized protein LOC110442284 isoform X2 [Mizuhopecten yessoensis]XP_021341496.1 uncharacterized protein LOC110442284 isoform X2 [Mizuhopecten yessoensis]XP_021341505.1 uncharacterized protein LOC110442284 isoform X2 [Mizuhopecten yessoensis]OWF54673.1 E3 ubiquitin-protein ligase TRIM56 [Mizuhopecten yessoensis]